MNEDAQDKADKAITIIVLIVGIAAGYFFITRVIPAAMQPFPETTCDQYYNYTVRDMPVHCLSYWGIATSTYE